MNHKIKYKIAVQINSDIILELLQCDFFILLDVLTPWCVASNREIQTSLLTGVQLPPTSILSWRVAQILFLGKCFNVPTLIIVIRYTYFMCYSYILLNDIYMLCLWNQVLTVLKQTQCPIIFRPSPFRGCPQIFNFVLFLFGIGTLQQKYFF